MIEIKSKRSTRASSSFNNKKSFLSSKRSQGGVFGLSFGMIVSIILIVFFVVAAFMGIRAFLSYQQCATLGMFTDDLQSGPEGIDTAWYADSATFNFSSGVPSGVKYVCFMNLTSPVKNANNEEKNMYSIIQHSAIPDYSYNFYIYAPNKDYCLKWKKIKHIDLSDKNPICFPAISGKVKMQITREFSNPLVKVS